ncbi:MAG: hypothetical protein LBR78_02095 [Holosporales bacterium]|jgi:hypothetical protein|nr:hypothetical protein [Holosporales bacterium]
MKKSRMRLLAAGAALAAVVMAGLTQEVGATRRHRARGDDDQATAIREFTKSLKDDQRALFSKALGLPAPSSDDDEKPTKPKETELDKINAQIRKLLGDAAGDDDEANARAVKKKPGGRALQDKYFVEKKKGKG